MQRPLWTEVELDNMESGQHWPSQLKCTKLGRENMQKQMTLTRLALRLVDVILALRSCNGVGRVIRFYTRNCE